MVLEFFYWLVVEVVSCRAGEEDDCSGFGTAYFVHYGFWIEVIVRECDMAIVLGQFCRCVCHFDSFFICQFGLGMKVDSRNVVESLPHHEMAAGIVFF